MDCSAKPAVLTRFCYNLSNVGISINVYGVGVGRKVVRAVDDDTPQSRVAYFLGVAETLRETAAGLRFDPRRGNQLLALADGFERFARRLEREAATGTTTE
jgi:hypothetical protein